MKITKETIESRLKTCQELADRSIDFDAGTEYKYYEEVEKFLILEEAFLKILLEDLKNLPNELRAVNRNEAAKEVCEICHKSKPCWCEAKDFNEPLNEPIIL